MCSNASTSTGTSLGWISSTRANSRVRPIRSLEDLRGVLKGETDEQGQSATELLREGREQDTAREEELRRRHAGDE